MKKLSLIFLLFASLAFGQTSGNYRAAGTMVAGVHTSDTINIYGMGLLNHEVQFTGTASGETMIVSATTNGQQFVNVGTATSSSTIVSFTGANYRAITISFSGMMPSSPQFTWTYNGYASPYLVGSGTVAGNLTVNGTLTATGGVTPSGVILATDGTAVAPSYAFASDTGTGLYRATASQLGITLNGVAAARFLSASGSELWLASDTAKLSFGAAEDIFLTRTAADTVALKTSANTQSVFRVYGSTTKSFSITHDGTYSILSADGASPALIVGAGTSQLGFISGEAAFRAWNGDNTTDAGSAGDQWRNVFSKIFTSYNVYTDASNYDSFSLAYVGNRAQLSSTKAGSGTARALDIGGATLSIFPSTLGDSTGRWNVLTTSFSPNSDDSISFGASSTRASNVFATKASFGVSGALTFSATAPTISSGFGSSSSITAGSATSFRLNVGTGGTATGGVVGLPTATTGWNCFAADITTPASFTTYQTASSTTTATLANYSRTTGLLIAWTASDILAINCTAF